MSLNKMSVNDFLTKQNVSLIWEVIMDDVLKHKPEEVIIKINNIFNSNLQGFFENEKHKSRNVMELNKKYISLIINYIDGNFQQKQPQQPQQPQKPQHKILEKELITHDDLQSDRMSQFDNKLNTIKQEFFNAMALPVPEKPEFGDKIDEPLTELELEIKKVMAQRNYDIEQINRNNLESNTNSNTTNANWLKPQETSIKNEKINPLQQKSNIKSSPQLHQQQQQIRYIKIDNDDLNNEIIQNDVIDINNDNNGKKIISPKKQVSWNNNIEYENNIEDDFLKKLKTIKPSESQFVSNINNTDEINSIKEEIKTFNVKIENLTQNVNAILELLKHQKL